MPTSSTAGLDRNLCQQQWVVFCWPNSIVCLSNGWEEVGPFFSISVLWQVHVFLKKRPLTKLKSDTIHDMVGSLRAWNWHSQPLQGSPPQRKIWISPFLCVHRFSHCCDVIIFEVMVICISCARLATVNRPSCLVCYFSAAALPELNQFYFVFDWCLSCSW